MQEKSIERCLQPLCVFINVSMNYYTIQHSIIVNKQLRGTALDLFTDYGLPFLMDILNEKHEFYFLDGNKNELYQDLQRLNQQGLLKR